MEYAEGAAIATSLAMLGGMWMFLQRLITTKLSALETIIVKLIDRFNRNDDEELQRTQMLIQKLDEVEREIAMLREKLSYVTGRINGGAGN
jgi:hypothetical protein